MEKGGGGDQLEDSPQIIIPHSKLTTPQIPPLRLNDEPTTLSQSSHLLANHKQQGQRQSIFRQQSKEVPSLERCPCCNNSPSSSTFERQHNIISSFTSTTHNVPQIHIEHGWTENVEEGIGTVGSDGELLPQTSDSQGKPPPIRRR
ncbi:unnamed protein product [Meloidogyne enterolobii]